jgi:hypothetical protein
MSRIQHVILKKKGEVEIFNNVIDISISFRDNSMKIDCSNTGLHTRRYYDYYYVDILEGSFDREESEAYYRVLYKD